MNDMLGHNVEGALGWLAAGLVVSTLFSITHGPAAWWLLAVVSPFALTYSLLALSEARRRSRAWAARRRSARGART